MKFRYHRAQKNTLLHTIIRPSGLWNCVVWLVARTVTALSVASVFRVMVAIRANVNCKAPTRLRSVKSRAYLRLMHKVVLKYWTTINPCYFTTMSTWPGIIYILYTFCATVCCSRHQYSLWLTGTYCSYFVLTFWRRIFFSNFSTPCI